MPIRVGILTGGGDCPGLNAVIRAVVRRCVARPDTECIGVLRGWRGMLDGLTCPLDLDAVSGILPRGGTILRTSRANPFSTSGGPGMILRNMKKFRLDALVCIGGDDTLRVAARLFEEHHLPVVGIPKTIDNDVHGTEYAFGFDSTVNIAMEAIDRIHTTAESHDRVMIVEVMGRNAGWIAIHAGLAAGADIILIPEKPCTLNEVCDAIISRHDRGKDFSIIVVAEGARISRTGDEEPIQYTQESETDEFGRVRLGGVGSAIAGEIERRTGFQTRVTVLGHIQRGGTPTAFDRVLGTRFGVKAADLVFSSEFGKMVALQANHIVAVPLAEVARERRLVPEEFWEVAQTFFG